MMAARYQEYNLAVVRLWFWVAILSYSMDPMIIMQDIVTGKKYVTILTDYVNPMAQISSNGGILFQDDRISPSYNSLRP